MPVVMKSHPGVEFRGEHCFGLLAPLKKFHVASLQNKTEKTTVMCQYLLHQLLICQL